MSLCEKNIDCLECQSRAMCNSYALFKYDQGRRDERKIIMEIVDSADDVAQAMYLLGQYIIQQELRKND